MVFPGWDGPSTFKSPIEQLKLGNEIHIQPSPVRQLSITRAADLVGEESCTPILHAVIMRLNNAILVSIPKPDEPPLPDCTSQQVVDHSFGSSQRTQSSARGQTDALLVYRLHGMRAGYFMAITSTSP
jgi:hypothetical protein